MTVCSKRNARWTKPARRGSRPETLIVANGTLEKGEQMNTTLTLQEQIEAAKVLWASALPDVPCPPDGTIRLWLSEHEYRMLEGALAYCPRRVERMRKNGRYTPVTVYK